MFTFGLGNLLWVMLLLTNAVAILNHDRFLVPLGLTAASASQSSASLSSTPNYGFDSYAGHPTGQMQEGPSIKYRLVTLMSAVRTLMRIPLIPLNIIVIVYEMLLG